MSVPVLQHLWCAGRNAGIFAVKFYWICGWILCVYRRLTKIDIADIDAPRRVVALANWVKQIARNIGAELLYRNLTYNFVLYRKYTYICRNISIYEYNS